MKRKRPVAAALALCLALLAGCAPKEPETPTHLTWLHGFYADSSYGQIGLADAMDAVSLGWGRMYVDDQGAPYVNSRYTEGNSWVIPQGSHLATDYFTQRAIPYNLCVYATTAQRYGETNVLEYLLTPAVRESAVTALVEATAAYSGLTLDFEGLSRNAEGFTDFVSLVRDRLPADKLLYVTVQPRAWYKGYDYRALGRLCDKVILMAHDYQWQQAPEENLGSALTDTPVAPLPAVEQALRDITDEERGVADRSKIVLAVAFATAGVEVDEEGLLLGTTIYTPSSATLAGRLAQPDAQPGWSEVYASPYVYYHNEEGRRYRVWYEDAQSVSAKIDLALQYGVTGLSLWRLGTVPDDPSYSVWPAITGRLAP